MRLIDKLDPEKIGNPHLKKLVQHLKMGVLADVDPLQITPETAQRFQRWNHHTDHRDYQQHSDYSNTGPSHGDYCD